MAKSVRGNPDKLQPVRTKREASERGAAGGKASGEARRRKKAMQETFRAVLSMPLKPGDSITADEILSLADVKGANLTVQDAIAFAQAQKAMAGDTRAAEFIRDTMGERPTEKLEVSGNVEVAANRIRELIDKRKAEDGSE